MKNKNTKLVSMRILVDDLDSVKRQLEEMAESGWILVMKQGNRFLFGKFEGRKLNFAVTLFDKASEYDTFPNEKNLEYIEYCEKAGWHYICSAGKVQIFYSEDLNLTPIDTDDRVKLKAICKANRSAVIFWYLISLVSLPKLVLSMTIDRNLVELSILGLTATVIDLSFVIEGLVQLVRWHTWKKRCKRSIDSGSGFIARTHMRQKTRNILTYAILSGWIIAGLIAWAKFGQYEDLWVPIMCIVGLLMILITNGIAKKMDRRRAEASTNAAYRTSVPLLFMAILIFISLFFMPYKDYRVSRALPLTLEALGVEASAAGTYDIDSVNNGRFLISLDSYSIDAKGITEISYDIYETDIKAIYNRLLRDAENGTFRSSGIRFSFSEAEEIEGLKAKDAYAGRNEEYYKYLFLYDGVIVVVESRFAFTDEQLTIADNVFSELRPGETMAD